MPRSARAFPALPDPRPPYFLHVLRFSHLPHAPPWLTSFLPRTCCGFTVRVSSVRSAPLHSGTRSQFATKLYAIHLIIPCSPSLLQSVQRRIVFCTTPLDFYTCTSNLTHVYSLLRSRSTMNALLSITVCYDCKMLIITCPAWNCIDCVQQWQKIFDKIADEWRKKLFTKITAAFILGFSIAVNVRRKLPF